MRRYKIAYKPRSIRRLERNSKRNIILAIILIILFAYVLLNWGLPGLIGSLSLFNNFKTTNTVKTSTLEDTSLAPPILNIPFEATNSASIIITGFSIPKSEVEIYIDEELKNTVGVQENGSFETMEIELSQGTNNISAKTIDEGRKKSLSSKTIKVMYSNEKPKLEITEPNDGKQIQGGDKKVPVSGTTNPDNNLTINDLTVIVNNSGSFNSEIGINEGDNVITILATNKYGNATQIQRNVKYSP